MSILENESTNHQCMCYVCNSLLQITDGDYDHEFLRIQKPKLIIKCIQPFYIRLHVSRLSGCRAKYVKFTVEQKKYLQHVFQIYPFVGCHDINKTRIIFICDNLIKMGSDQQKITKSMVMSWFKNERFRRNIHKVKKLRR